MLFTYINLPKQNFQLIPCLIYCVENEELTRKLREKLLRFERESRFLRKDSDQRKVIEEVFDTSTLLALEELVRRNYIIELYGVVRAGKEARVYYGVTDDGSARAVKIYLTTTAEFRKRLIYIAGDIRFGRLPTTSRETVYLWVQKEFKNLQQANSVGIRVPRPYGFYKNLLVMEYIGNPPHPAPTFAETDVDKDDFKWTFKTISALYARAKLVHADLSEYNIFKLNNERVLFDFGSAVLNSHPNAEEFLLRDITNMVRFFKRRGIYSKEPQEWLREIIK